MSVCNTQEKKKWDHYLTRENWWAYMYFNILYWILILTIVVSTVLLGSEWSSWGCCRFGADKLSFFYPHGWSNVLLNSTCICAVGSPLWIFHNSKACRLEKVWVLTTSSTHIQLHLLFGWSLHESNSFYTPHSTHVPSLAAPYPFFNS